MPKLITEALSAHELLGYYLAREYADTPVLAIWEPDCGSNAELETLKGELAEFGYAAGTAAWGASVLLFTMNEVSATCIINKHRKGTPHMELWCNGKLMHQNA